MIKMKFSYENNQKHKNYSEYIYGMAMKFLETINVFKNFNKNTFNNLGIYNYVYYFYKNCGLRLMFQQALFTWHD